MPSGSSSHGREAQRKAAQLLREQRARERRRRVLTWSIVGVVAVIAVAAVTITIVVNAKPTESTASGIPATPASKAHGASDAPPWAAPANPTARAKAAGLKMLGAEGTVEHIHSHLSVTVDGRPVTVPALIGIDEKAQTISPLHSHDTSGIIHVESPVKATFTLGQFFTEWDVALNAQQVGSLGTTSGETVTTFVDGKKISGDPAALTLADREDIDIVVTKSGTAAAVPKTFSWPTGY